MLLASPYAWQLDFDSAVVVPTLTLIYLFALGRLGAPRWRVSCFGAALVLLGVAFWTPVHHLGLHYLLSMHLLQNVILAEWAPLLAVLGLSPAMARAVARVRAWRVATHPLVALPLWLGTYFAWHIPRAYDFALQHPVTVLHLEHLSYLAAGIALWWPALRHGLTHGPKAGYVFAAFVLGSPLGLLLALLPSAVYRTYRDGPGLWGLGALSDQQLAGLTMAGEQAVVFFAVFAVFFLRFLREEEARGTTIAR